MSTRGKRLHTLQELFDVLTKGGSVLEVSRGDNPKERVVTGKTVPRMDMVEFEYFENIEYEGPFGNIVWCREKGEYVFRFNPDGEYVRREDYEQQDED